MFRHIDSPVITSSAKKLLLLYCLASPADDNSRIYTVETSSIGIYCGFIFPHYLIKYNFSLDILDELFFKFVEFSKRNSDCTMYVVIFLYKELTLRRARYLVPTKPQAFDDVSCTALIAHYFNEIVLQFSMKITLKIKFFLALYYPVYMPK